MNLPLMNILSVYSTMHQKHPKLLPECSKAFANNSNIFDLRSSFNLGIINILFWLSHLSVIYLITRLFNSTSDRISP